MKTCFAVAACALAVSLVLMPRAYAQFGGGGSGRHGGGGKGCDREASKATPAVSGSTQTIRAWVDHACNRMTVLEDLEMSAKTLFDLQQDDQKPQVDLRLMPFLAPLLRG